MCSTDRICRSPKSEKDELGAFVLVIFLIILVYQGGAMGGFVIYVVIVFVLVYKAHVEGHLAGSSWWQ